MCPLLSPLGGRGESVVRWGDPTVVYTEHNVTGSNLIKGEEVNFRSSVNKIYI